MGKDRNKILIADDEASIRDGLKAILTPENYDLLFAKDGREAVELFKRQSPDLVILDVSMPILTGFQALEKIKKFVGERYVPIIFLSATANVDYRVKALSGGAVDYLAKPISPIELIIRVRNFMTMKNKHDELNQAAVYDWMTGALNKGPFLKKAEEELERSKRNNTPLSLIFMDADKFKEINDTVGHIAGDNVIMEIGKRLRRSVRNIDLIGRFGGDEFMVLLPSKGLKETTIVAKRIQDSISSRPVTFEKKRIKITLSQGGIALEQHGKESLREIMRAADESLYESKDKGGNCFVINIFCRS